MADFRVELDDAVRQPRPPLRRAEAGRRRAARAACTTRRTTPRRWSACSPSPGTSPAVEPPDYLLQLSPGPVRAGAGPGGGAVRGGGAAGRAGVHRGVRPAGRAPGRADHRRRRGRPAQGLPRLGGGQPGRVLRPVPRAERPLERAARRAGRAGPAGGAGRGRPGPARQPGRCASGSRPSSPQVQSALDGMLVERPRRRILRQATAPGEA